MQDKTQWLIGGTLGVLLIHGLGGSPTEMAALARALHAAGHTVCSVQLAGHGSCRAELAYSTADDWRDSALAAHAVLSRRCDTVLVVGLSMGALLALDVARLRPSRVQGLALLAPALRLDGWAMPRLARFVGRLSARLAPASLTVDERFPHGVKDDRIRARVVAAMKCENGGAAFSTPLRSLVAFGELSDLVRSHLSTIGQPTLVIHPRDDDMASLSNAHEIATNLRGPVDMLVLDDSYHLVTVDRQRRLVEQRVAAFASALSDGTCLRSSPGNSTKSSLHIPSSVTACVAGSFHGDVS